MFCFVYIQVVNKVKRFHILTEIAAVEHQVKYYGPVIGRFVCPYEFSDLDEVPV
jgi:hypothetical protein